MAEFRHFIGDLVKDPLQRHGIERSSPLRFTHNPSRGSETI